MAQVKAPKRLILHFNDAHITYDIKHEKFSIVIHGDTISKGSNWEVYRPSDATLIYHLREEHWKDIYWRVNTSQRKVFRITNGYFSRYEEDYKGNEMELPIQVDIDGAPGSPQRFSLRVSDVDLVYEAENKTLRITAQDDSLDFGKSWKIKPIKRESPISTIKRATVTGYHMRKNFWEKFYWEVNIAKRKIYRVKSGDFGKGGGNFEQLDITVEVIE